MNKNLSSVTSMLGMFVLVLAVLYFFPWGNIRWGKVVMEPSRVLTVSGTAESKVKNQIAKFSAGVNAVNDNRDVAVKEVNNKIAAITEAVKVFGINSDDIITQSMSVYQMQQTVYEDGQQKQKPGQWQVSNTIEITLRDVDKTGQLADLLTKNGANNVYGPNFQLDTSKKAEDELTADAVADARKKAEVMAASVGAGLGKVISITEGVSTGGLYPFLARGDMGGGGGGAPVQVGTSTVSKTVTVVWSLE